jgi:S1-C subfamily serine protease
MFGAAAGGILVYQYVRQQQASITPLPADTTVEALPASSQEQTLAVNTTDVETAVTQAVQNVGPTVVTVVATIPGQNTFFGQTGDSTSTGSGVFISQDGYILTNNHVIESAQSYSVIFSDGSELPATLVERTNIPTWQCSKSQGPCRQ